MPHSILQPTIAPLEGRARVRGERLSQGEGKLKPRGAGRCPDLRKGLLATLLALAASASLSAQTISTLAGTGTKGFVNASRRSASFNVPTSVYGNAAGVLYVADTGNHVIRAIGLDDIVTTLAGTGVAGFSTGPASSAQLDSPTGLFVTATGDLYIADTGNHVIRRIAAGSTTITTVAGTPDSSGFTGDGSSATSAKLNSPSGVYVTSSGVIYIADTGNHRVRQVSSGVITTLAGTGSAGFGGDGGPASQALLNSPSAVFASGVSVAVSSLFIADTANHRIRAITLADNVISTFAGTSSPGFSGDGGPPSSARLVFPASLFADGVGNVYIADRFNNRVRRANASGTMSTLVGDGALAFGGDNGPANLGQLASPTGLFVDAAQTIYIADSGNHRIRRIVADDVSGLSGSSTTGLTGKSLSSGSSSPVTALPPSSPSPSPSPTWEHRTPQPPA